WQRPRTPREMKHDRSHALLFLNGSRSSLAGANADHILDRGDEDLAVPDPAGAATLDDGLDGFRDPLVRDQHGDLHLGEEIDDVLRPAVELRVTPLAAEALHLAHRQALHPHAGQPFLHLVELVGLDDRVDPLHGLTPPSSKTPTTAAVHRTPAPGRPRVVCCAIAVQPPHTPAAPRAGGNPDPAPQ